ncbi:YwqI/YxiC family protein [Bacillus sp. F19]|nr:YwqI/YxiC family protein [Bacillus sp. F19]
MAAKEIKLDKESLQSTLNELKKAIDNFNSYTTTFNSNTRNQLESFNSDFIEKVDTLLENMTDNVNTDLIKNMNAIHKVGEELLRNMKETDEEISDAIRSGK